MGYLPSYISAELKVMFSLNHCVHFVKNETFSNTCDSMNADNINMCCEDLIQNLFGDMKLNHCYQDTSYKNYTSLQFECVNPPDNKDKLINLLEAFIIMFGFIFIMCCMINLTDRVKISETKKNKMEKDNIITLNKCFNIQDGKYQTFSLQK